mmetsp:Transcript_50756/g.51163  ORF Transcript_50756/g.51163 Transcript_50756/m.51163 type:complete len:95 (+) Transcript_50756:549-833(+)|eukprot:CAMPEP_0171310952 /NCGR_PEP_ID=MMETSP0816-20121228/21146_1 /TAXON_ID=420281 /ORGANISM="Proboscia inermis, Strain CCAP1064/1" /LENGTH=94 /DNA_ID=CAMNT_0011795369 /DNA_START=549 /DNA_END=833 /DNA_ORIENTATION=-
MAEGLGFHAVQDSGYTTVGMVYEWTHYIVHTRFVQSSKFFRRMKNHHQKHHVLNSKYWLGFSLIQMDDLFGTNPSVAEAKKQEKQVLERMSKNK